MNLFAAVKETVTTRDAAVRYGLHVSHSGMCVCPFHADKNPSMKVDERFHCFGCQADGDVISFTARLFHLSPKEAAQQLAHDFGVRYDMSIPYTVRKRPETAEQVFERQLAHCYHVLSAYRNRLMEWRELYAPQTPTEAWHPRFVEALRETTQVEYQLDLLLDGSPAEKQQVVSEQAAKLSELESHIQRKPIKERESLFSALRAPSSFGTNKSFKTEKEMALQ